jgi:hypothetical protein
MCAATAGQIVQVPDESKRRNALLWLGTTYIGGRAQLSRGMPFALLLHHMQVRVYDYKQLQTEIQRAHVLAHLTACLVCRRHVYIYKQGKELVHGVDIVHLCS